MPEQHVTKATCDDRHKGTWRVITAVLTISVLTACSATQALRMSYGAQRGIDIHAAGQDARDQHIQKSLDRIEAEQLRHRESLEELLQAKGE